MIRKTYLDLLRVISTVGVIAIHTLGGFASEGMEISRSLQMIFTYCVPLFVMISGVIWLDKDKQVDIVQMWGRNILRIVTSFCFWSIFYIIYFHDYDTIKDIVIEFISGHYHMWFCYMIVGIYIFIPIVRAISEKEGIFIYFVFLQGVINIILPWLISLPKFNALAYEIELMGFSTFMRYMFYFSLGHLLSQKNIDKWIRVVIYIVANIYLIFVIFNIGSYDDFSPLRIIYTTAIFIFIKNIVENREPLTIKMKNFLKLNAQCCYGIYLIHVFVFDIIQKVCERFAVPIYSGLVIVFYIYIVSLFLVLGIRKIPYVNRYIT